MIDGQGFLISRHWRDTRRGVELEYWLSTDSGPVQLILSDQTAVFFLPTDQCEQAVQCLAQAAERFDFSHDPGTLRNFSLQPVSVFYFKQQRQLRLAKERLQDIGLAPLEADIKPCDRFLMERFVRGSLRFRGHGRGATSTATTIINPDITDTHYRPHLRVISLDIETAMEGLSLYSIAVYARETEDTAPLRQVFMVASEPVGEGVDTYPDEKALLLGFMDWLADYDPDIIMGWNVINFDLWFLSRLCEKHQLPFRLGRGGDTPHWRTMGDDSERRALSVAGRIILDGIEALKAAAYRFESFALNFVASEVLNEGKLIQGAGRGETITELFHHDKPALAAYNLQDCKLVWDIVERLSLIDFMTARSHLTGLPFDRIGGSVASFDFRYLPLLHRQGFVAPNGHLSQDIEASPGGFVMESKPGIYDHVLVLDFKSLYPSIIRSFKIDPMGMAIGLHETLDQCDLVPGFRGAWFAKNQHLLPAIIAQLWQARDEAKANDDGPLSHAIKIIMNAFYGVLGSGGCRFFDSRLASSITLRGHQIIQQTAEYIEQQSIQGARCSVIYGDTDSVFVWLKNCNSPAEADRAGQHLAGRLNQWWNLRLQKEYGIESALEIEYETHYQRFLMPTVRGSAQGSKKRYAGVILKDGQRQLVFKGLENVRTDWTRLAREFQQQLYEKIFFDQPYHAYIQQEVNAVLAGERDEQLVYRKRLRRHLNEYSRNIPPHVQAARKAEAAGVNIRRGDWVEYVITVNGAEPLQAQVSLLNYQHYIDRQLAPVADSLLYFLGESLAAITDQQLSMF